MLVATGGGPGAPRSVDAAGEAELIRAWLGWLSSAGHSEAAVRERRAALARIRKLLPGGLLETSGPSLAACVAALRLSAAGHARHLAWAREFREWAEAQALTWPLHLAAADVMVERRHLGWLAARRMSPSTIGERRKVLSLLRRDLAAPLLHAGPADLGRWAAGVSARLAPATAAAYISHVREFYRWAAVENHIPANPARRIAGPRVPRRLPRPVSESDLKGALAGAGAKVRVWLVLAGWCGLRAKEIARLRRENILDTAAPPVLIVASDAAKGSRERVVPLAPFVLDELERAGLLAARAGWLFPAARTPGPVTPNWVSTLSGRALRAAGLDVTLHQFRHRFGSQLWSATHDLRLVQELLGHQDPRTTAIYTAWDRPGAAAAVGSLPVPGGPQR